MALPDRRALRRRLAWLAASFALLALAGLAIWLARPDERADAPAPPRSEPLAVAPPAPTIEALTREDLVAAAQAALLPPLTAGAGERPPAISGQRFEVSLPVRCPEPLGAGSNAPLTYNYDTMRQAVTLTALPQAWQDTPLAAALAPAETFEAVEGFWIGPLNVAAPTCARTPPAPLETGSEPAEAEKGGEGERGEAAETAAVPPTHVGLAVFFEPGGSRTVQRRDRPYRVTRKAPPPAQQEPFRLVLSGRVLPFEEGPAIRCHEPPGEPPACLIAASIDKVAFVDAATGQVLAEWDG